MFTKLPERKSFSAVRRSTKSLSKNPSINYSSGQIKETKTSNVLFPSQKIVKSSIAIPEIANSIQEKSFSIIHKNCEIHGKPLDAFCKHCYKLICVHCIIDFQHNGHLLEKPTTAFLKEREKLSAIRQSVHESGKALQLNIEKIDLNFFEDKTRLECRLKRISESYEKIVESLTRSYHDLADQIK
jgi:hypothetical protein